MPIHLALALLWSAPAAAIPLELPDDACAAWHAAAALAGFEPGPCIDPPCVRLRGDTLELCLPDRPPRLQPVDGLDPETALAIARSQLVLPARPAPAPAPPPPVVVPVPPPAAPTIPAVVASPASEPAVPVVLVSAPVPPPAPPPPPAVSPRRLGATLDASAGWDGALALHAATPGRHAWWGAGGRVDGAFALEAGGGLARTWGVTRWRLGGWTGVEVTPRDCLLCSVDESLAPDGSTTRVTSGLYTAEADGRPVSPVGRVAVDVALPLHRRLRLTPRAGAVVSARGLRPDLACGLRWSLK